jgi:hypothetical protein
LTRNAKMLELKFKECSSREIKVWQLVMLLRNRSRLKETPTQSQSKILEISTLKTMLIKRKNLQKMRVNM